MTLTHEAIEFLAAARALASAEGEADPDEMVAEALVHIDDALERLREHERLVTRRGHQTGRHA